MRPGMSSARLATLAALASFCALAPRHCFAQSPAATPPSPVKSAAVAPGPFDRLELLAFLYTNPDAAYAIETIRQRGTSFNVDPTFLLFAECYIV